MPIFITALGRKIYWPEFGTQTGTHNNSCLSCSYQTVQITSKNSGLSGPARTDLQKIVAPLPGS